MGRGQKRVMEKCVLKVDEELFGRGKRISYRGPRKSE